MAPPVLTGTVHRPPTRPEVLGFDPRAVLTISLPAHVAVQLADGWQPAWLIGRQHCADGWVVVVQCTDTAGHEQTLRLPANRIALPHN